MPKHAPGNRRSGRGPSPKPRAAATMPVRPTDPEARPRLFLLAALMLAGSLASMAVLTLQHLAGLSVPGCGPTSACAAIANTVWGKVPLVNYPVSSVGLAYFAALLVAWLTRPWSVLRHAMWLVRLGALISIAYGIVLMVGRHMCPYCIAAHVGNLLFWVLAESVKPRGVDIRPDGPLAARFTGALAMIAWLFLGLTAVLAGTEYLRRDRIARQEQAELDQSMQRIVDSSRDANQPGAATRPSMPTTIGELPTLPASVAGSPDGRGPGAATTAPALPPVQGPLPPETSVADGTGTPSGFTGRHRLGPREASIRIVVFSDFQCADCRAIEMQARQILAARSDVSLSHKHFPMSNKCNRMMGNADPHPNACWAARAAEAAGILRGEEGFWQMHHWLFDRQGAFTDAELNAALQQMGYNVAQFLGVMQSERTMELVKADIEEAIDLGLHFTPMIFINGEELRGYRTPGALLTAVDRLAAENFPPASPERDQPPRAADKYVADWREQPRRALPANAQTWSLGPVDAKAVVTVITDLRAPETADVMKAVRAMIDRGDSVRLQWRHFPYNPECNPHVKTVGQAQGCRASRAAEAAGLLGGNRAFWAMIDWLLANPTSTLDDQALAGAAASAGLEGPALLESMRSEQVVAAIADDVAVGIDALWRGNLPTVYVNDRIVPRWRLEGADVLGAIVSEAGRQP